MVGLTVTFVSPIVYEAGSMFALNEISFSARYGIFPFTGSIVSKKSFTSLFNVLNVKDFLTLYGSVGSSCVACCS